MHGAVKSVTCEITLFAGLSQTAKPPNVKTRSEVSYNDEKSISVERSATLRENISKLKPDLRFSFFYFITWRLWFKLIRTKVLQIFISAARRRKTEERHSITRSCMHCLIGSCVILLDVSYLRSHCDKSCNGYKAINPQKRSFAIWECTECIRITGHINTNAQSL